MLAARAAADPTDPPARTRTPRCAEVSTCGRELSYAAVLPFRAASDLSRLHHRLLGSADHGHRASAVCVVTTAYIFASIWLEERDLIDVFCYQSAPISAAYRCCCQGIAEPARRLWLCPDRVSWNAAIWSLSGAKRKSHDRRQSVAGDPNRTLTRGRVNNSALLFFSQVSIEIIV